MKLGKLTVTHLRKKFACVGQQIKFKYTFPNGFVPSKENFDKAVDADLNIGWALRTFVQDSTIHQRILSEARDSYWYYRNQRQFPSWQRHVATAWWNAIERSTQQ